MKDQIFVIGRKYSDVKSEILKTILEFVGEDPDTGGNVFKYISGAKDYLVSDDELVHFSKSTTFYPVNPQP